MPCDWGGGSSEILFALSGKLHKRPVTSSIHFDHGRSNEKESSCAPCLPLNRAPPHYTMDTETVVDITTLPSTLGSALSAWSAGLPRPQVEVLVFTEPSSSGVLLGRLVQNLL